MENFRPRAFDEVADSRVVFRVNGPDQLSVVLLSIPKNGFSLNGEAPCRSKSRKGNFKVQKPLEKIVSAKSPRFNTEVEVVTNRKEVRKAIA